MDYWFRMEVDGWEKLPDPPAMLVGIHSGAPFVWDAWTVGLQWWRRFGEERPLHGTAHDALMAMPLLGGTFARWACCRPRPTHHRVRRRPRRRAVARWGVRFAPPVARARSGRPRRTRGFVRLAIRSGVPIVPIATVGGPTRCRCSQPVAAWPSCSPRPGGTAEDVPDRGAGAVGCFAGAAARDTATDQGPNGFQDPIELDRDPERADDEAYLKASYRKVRDSIQGGMDALARRRRLPLFG